MLAYRLIPKIPLLLTTSVQLSVPTAHYGVRQNGPNWQSARGARNIFCRMQPYSRSLNFHDGPWPKIFPLWMELTNCSCMVPPTFSVMFSGGWADLHHTINGYIKSPRTQPISVLSSYPHHSKHSFNNPLLSELLLQHSLSSFVFSSSRSRV